MTRIEMWLMEFRLEFFKGLTAYLVVRTVFRKAIPRALIWNEKVAHYLHLRVPT